MLNFVQYGACLHLSVQNVWGAHFFLDTLDSYTRVQHYDNGRWRNPHGIYMNFYITLDINYTTRRSWWNRRQTLTKTHTRQGIEKVSWTMRPARRRHSFNKRPSSQQRVQNNSPSTAINRAKSIKRDWTIRSAKRDYINPLHRPPCSTAPAAAVDYTECQSQVRLLISSPAAPLPTSLHNFNDWNS